MYENITPEPKREACVVLTLWEFFAYILAIVIIVGVCAYTAGRTDQAAAHMRLPKCDKVEKAYWSNGDVSEVCVLSTTAMPKGKRS